jgi:hypothetical protein
MNNMIEHLRWAALLQDRGALSEDLEPWRSTSLQIRMTVGLLGHCYQHFL